MKTTRTFYRLSILIIIVTALFCYACGDEGSLVSGTDMPNFALNKAAHESTYAAALTPHEQRGIGASPPIPDTGWTEESIEAWVVMELEGLKKQLDDNLLTQARYEQLVAQVREDAQHERDRLLNVDFHIYIIPDPENQLKNKRGWEFDIIYGRTMVESDFQITISGVWEVQDFSSTQRSDGNYDVYFFLFTKSRRGIVNWAGLVQSIALDGNR